ncbi:MAG: CoB--CoM heterodisulfide reductase iron-sulfur subunit A family protein [Methanomicrobiales archaeon]|nr:CoB--CoM heterodisulfide reductase iron-sulfur subunit A family protein [Methanomicrobiales archaeon]
MSEVAVIGAGVAGIQAALDIANHGVQVHLIEREPTIGGHMAMLDKTFPTNDCSMCILSPKMVDVERHPLIRMHTCTEVVGIEGEVGNFSIRLVHHPRYIDEERCNGCGDCEEICPVEVYNRFDAGIGVRKAIYKPHAQIVPNVVIRDREHCIDCGLCYEVCDRDAILHDDEDREQEFTLTVASIVITTGYETFNACGKPQYAYLKIPDVISSMELERMINASGPTGGTLRRLSDGAPPKSLVFIQCVGSRDVAQGRPYCSCVCCMYAIKNAILIKEKNPDIDVTICYMDIRAYGKGYEEYYNRAETLGIRFLRGLPGEIHETADGMEMQIENTETGAVEYLHPDLVVLSVGLQPANGAEELAARLGIPYDETGFFSSPDPKVAPVTTIRPGIYVAGTAASPKDIPDSVMQAEAAAMRAFTDAIRAA